MRRARSPYKPKPETSRRHTLGLQPAAGCAVLPLHPPWEGGDGGNTATNRTGQRFGTAPEALHDAAASSMNRVSLAIRHFLLALQFFTRIPVTGRLAQWVGFSPSMLRASAGHFPGVGWVVGTAAAAVMLAGLRGLPGVNGALAAALLSTIATVLLTGAFHEDGLADVADGLGGSPDRVRALEIMKDSRIGAFGSIALVLAIGLKVALLASLAQQWAAPVVDQGGQSGQGAFSLATAIVLAHVLSRLAPLGLIRWLPHVGDNATSKSKPLADAIGAMAIIVAIFWSFLAVALAVLALGATKTIAAFVLCALVAVIMARWFLRRLGGFTGDALGATQQVCELAIYLALAWKL